jgi:purine nucleosidase
LKVGWHKYFSQKGIIVVIKCHIDTDIGGDIDDLCALAMVLNWPGVELLALTTNTDDHGRRAGYARYALGLVGRGEIPVAAGADVSNNYYRWNGQSIRPSLPDEAVYWPEHIPPAPTHLEEALDLLESSIKQGAIIAAIGAFTNLALLERRSPGILNQARLYLMGGYVLPPRKGFPSLGNNLDWNVQCDVPSAHYVFEHSNPTLIPLSVTVETSLRRAYLETLRQSGPLAHLIARQADAFANDEINRPELLYSQTWEALPNDTINFQHDPLACAIALGWHDGVEIRQIKLKSEIKGELLYQSIAENGKPTLVVTRINSDKFNEFWLEKVTSKTKKP